MHYAAHTSFLHPLCTWRGDEYISSRGHAAVPKSIHVAQLILGICIVHSLVKLDTCSWLGCSPQFARVLFIRTRSGSYSAVPFVCLHVFVCVCVLFCLPLHPAGYLSTQRTAAPPCTMCVTREQHAIAACVCKQHICALCVEHRCRMHDPVSFQPFFFGIYISIPPAPLDFYVVAGLR